ncbi:benzoylformate decarboxylase [Dipodascopsis uninucleata]
MEQPTVRDATFQLLRDLKLTKIFGNPGSTELSFLADLPKDFDYVLSLQEASAVGMADGYARATGRAAFVNLHSAAGVGNGLANVYTAYKNQAPLVITAGQQARSLLLRGAYLAADRATEFPHPYVKWSCEPAQAEDVPAAIARAYEIAMQPPYGPTFVSIPCDDWDKTAASYVKINRVLPFGPANGEGLAEVVKKFQMARKPVIVMGSEVATYRAYDDVVQLAERIKCDVWTAPNAYAACFPENHRLFRGFLPAIPERLSQLLSPYDFVLVIGAPVFTLHVPGQLDLEPVTLGVYQITVDSDSASRARGTVSLVGDLSTSVQLLLRDLEDLPETASPAKALEPLNEDTVRTLTVELIFQSMQQLLPTEYTIVEEAPSHRPALQRRFPITRKDGFYTMGSGGLGYSLPASVGVSLARPHERTIVIIGDGSLMYSIQALWTAAQLKLPITFIVLNNSGYGAMRSFSKLLGFQNVPGIDIDGIDFSGLAKSLGVQGTQATDIGEFKSKLKLSFETSYPTLIDVQIDPYGGDIY